MGDTVEELINLIICDVFYSLTKKMKRDYDIVKYARLFSKSLNCKNYTDTDLTIMDIISKYLIFIFGLNEKDAYECVFTLFTDEKLCNKNIELIRFLRNNDIKLVELQ